ncbi:MAG: Wzy polymerase domain-containing protein [Rhodoferax sp.]
MALLQYFDLATAFSPWINDAGISEAFANLRQRNQFATLTSIGLLTLLWQVGRRPSQLQSDTQVVRRLLLCAAVVLLALGNAASGSRTGLLQWLLIFGLAVVWRPRGQWSLLAVSAGAWLAYLVAALALPWVLEAVTGLSSGGLLGRFAEEAGCGSRRVLWSNVLHLIAQKPWAGWGWGGLDYAHFITLYPGERFCDILDNAHNLPLHLAVELGVPFALVVCGVGLCWVWRAKPWSEQDATRQLAWGVLAVILLHSMLEYPLWYGPFQLAAGLSVWLLWRTPESWRFKGFGLIGSACVAIVLIAAIGFAAWDYWRISQLYLPFAERASAYQEDTLQKVQGSWLFRDQVRFAELATTPLTPDHARQINTLAHQLLHFSPEPRVIEKLIESAVMLGRDDEALFYLQRFQAAFPQAHATWAAESGRHETP